MSYSTGSGDYTDLMAAVLSHSQADGWDDTGGDWPISKGACRGVDWDTTTSAATDFTETLSLSVTERLVRIALGSSGANATANLGTGDYAIVRNMQYAITAWHIFSDPAVYASGVLTLAANATDGDTVTIGATTYTLEDTLTDSANNVHIGASASDTIDNLIAAITAGVGAGTDYGTGTVANTEATAVAGTGNTIDVTALRAGPYGNTFVTTTAGGGDLTFAATTLTGGSGSDYIFVVFQFTNDFGYSNCFGHFGFGEIDQHGFGYSGMAFAGGSNTPGFAASTGTQNPWNYPNEFKHAYAGSYGNSDNGTSEFQFMLDPDDSPTPISGDWPQPDTLYKNGANVLTMSRYSYVGEDITQGSAIRALNNWAWASQNQPFSGAITLGVMPVIILNGNISTSSGMWVGVMPNIRLCRLDNYSPGDEVTHGADTWMVFPLLRSTPDTELSVARTVTTGRMGYAYKKVT